MGSYALLASHDRGPTALREIALLKSRLAAQRQLGSTRRERLALEAADEYLAREDETADPEARGAVGRDHGPPAGDLEREGGTLSMHRRPVPPCPRILASKESPGGCERDRAIAYFTAKKRDPKVKVTFRVYTHDNVRDALYDALARIPKLGLFRVDR